MMTTATQQAETALAYANEQWKKYDALMKHAKVCPRQADQDYQRKMADGILDKWFDAVELIRELKNTP